MNEYANSQFEFHFDIERPLYLFFMLQAGIFFWLMEHCVADMKGTSIHRARGEEFWKIRIFYCLSRK